MYIPFKVVLCLCVFIFGTAYFVFGIMEPLLVPLVDDPAYNYQEFSEREKEATKIVFASFFAGVFLLAAFVKNLEYKKSCSEDCD